MTNDDIYNNLKLKSPYFCKEPNDMLYFSNLYNKAKLNQSFPKPGIHTYLNEHEEARSKQNWSFFQYTINKCGFRDHFPEKNATNIIGFFGCSITFGEGMDTKDNFPYQVSQKLQMNCLNLGMPGASSQRIALIFDAASNIWNIDTAVITLPDYSRVLYMESEGNLVNIIPAHPNLPGENEQVRMSIVNYFSDNALRLNFVNAINYIIAVAKSKKIKLILGVWETECLNIIKHVFDYSSPMLTLGPLTARDNAHPHPSYCNQYGNLLLHYISEKQYVR